MNVVVDTRVRKRLDDRFVRVDDLDVLADNGDFYVIFDGAQSAYHGFPFAEVERC